MSYEYRLVFPDSTSANRAMEALMASAACVGAQCDRVLLKDRQLNTLAEYDIRLTKEGQNSLWLEVNFRSVDLLLLLETTFAGLSVQCFEDGDPQDEVTLESALRINAGA